MVEPPDVARLTEFLREEYGDDLRAVISYRRGSYQFAYVRDDLTAAYAETNLDGLLTENGIETGERRSKERVFDHGDLRWTVKCFDEAIKCYLFAGPRSGIAVTLNPTALSDPRTTVDEWPEVAGGVTCRERKATHAVTGTRAL